ncbi:MAG: hypothetical protein GXP49_06120 [Deltaproteobacteria bacterium]|nr:hypothetical protein [Deltaproteobacteria bacterium]
MTDKNKKGNGNPGSEDVNAMPPALTAEEQAWLDEKKAGRKRRVPEKPYPFQMNSMLDILTIILVFLLKSYSTNPVNITQSNDLTLPISTSTLKPEHTVTVAISKKDIMVDNNAVVEVRDGKVDASAKRDGEHSYFITPLYDALFDKAENARNVAKYNPDVEFKGRLTVIADEETPFRLLSEVMYTAGQAEYSQYKFAVIQGSE